MLYQELTEKVIGCAIEVHQNLGPGLLESVYERCLSYELARVQVGHDVQVEVPVVYKGIELDCGFRVDIIVENNIVVELKSVHQITPVHEAQLLTYMKLRKAPVGLLLNFNVALLKNGGIKRYAIDI